MIDFGLYWRTVKHLKRKQVLNRLSRSIKNQLHVNARYELKDASSGLHLQPFPRPKPSWSPDQSFNFLFQRKNFANEIDWNFSDHGKLWTYHLNYLECLIQEDIKKSDATKIIELYRTSYPNAVDGKEPYPTSLRLLHIIKSLSLFRIQDVEIDKWIGTQALLLREKLEYHLLGNHLLENGFALLYAAFHLKDKEIYTWAYEILHAELQEQILDDGAHFELSPSYHFIILSRVLDAINLIQSNNSFDDDLLSIMIAKAGLMLCWLNNMTFFGQLPQVNDSIEIKKEELAAIHSYAYQLGITADKKPLGSSGYRRLFRPSFDLLFDVGAIGPDYIPGHAHADSLQFLLWINGKAIITDTGISTYERNEQRLTERSTYAHNTVVVDNTNSSEVWSSFRVGDRATIIDLIESHDSIFASHSGYQHLDAIHSRHIQISETTITITDEVESSVDHSCFASLHFHFNLKPIIQSNRILMSDCSIRFKNAEKIELLPYQYAQGFNKQKTALKAVVHFYKHLSTQIQIHPEN